MQPGSATDMRRTVKVAAESNMHLQKGGEPRFWRSSPSRSTSDQRLNQLEREMSSSQALPLVKYQKIVDIVLSYGRGGKYSVERIVVPSV